MAMIKLKKEEVESLFQCSKIIEHENCFEIIATDGVNHISTSISAWRPDNDPDYIKRTQEHLTEYLRHKIHREIFKEEIEKAIEFNTKRVGALSKVIVFSDFNREGLYLTCGIKTMRRIMQHPDSRHILLKIEELCNEIE